MTQAMHSLEAILNKCILWAEANEDIRAVLVIGSRPRAERPADIWTDLDLIVIARQADSYLETAGWLNDIAPVWVAHVERTAVGNSLERRVIFEGGADVDFLFIPESTISALVQEPKLARVLRRGVRLLVDKDRIGARLTLPVGMGSVYRPPTESEFLNAVNDFWYHAVWTTRKLQRGELWAAKFSCDSYMKGLLLQMLEWHTHATRRENYDAAFQGRFLEQWADPRVLQQLQYAFAHYDADDLRRALAATMDIFRGLATETATQLSYPYPAESDQRVTAWVTATLKSSETAAPAVPEDDPHSQDS